jgi:hypothetical protein
MSSPSSDDYRLETFVNPGLFLDEIQQDDGADEEDFVTSFGNNYSLLDNLAWQLKQCKGFTLSDADYTQLLKSGSNAVITKIIHYLVFKYSRKITPFFLQQCRKFWREDASSVVGAAFETMRDAGIRLTQECSVAEVTSEKWGACDVTLKLSFLIDFVSLARKVKRTVAPSKNSERTTAILAFFEETKSDG